MAIDSTKATLAVKRRLACEMVKYWQQVQMQKILPQNIVSIVEVYGCVLLNNSFVDCIAQNKSLFQFFFMLTEYSFQIYILCACTHMSVH